jgi:hypothetical protein
MSTDQRFFAYLRTDGIFELREFSGQFRKYWTAGSTRQGPYRITMQWDGNLVIYDRWGATWASRTQWFGRAPYRLAIQGNGDLAIYDSSYLKNIVAVYPYK